MYDLGTVKRKIEKEGVDNLISELSSEDFSETVKKDLTACNILVGGFPNLSLIYSLT